LAKPRFTALESGERIIHHEEREDRMICVYLNSLWDPIQIKPLRPDPPHLPWWVRHAFLITVVLAGTIGAISRLLFGETWTRILSLSGVGIIATIMVYFILRLWWYRARS
jgi:hypothetical protein